MEIRIQSKSLILIHRHEVESHLNLSVFNLRHYNGTLDIDTRIEIIVDDLVFLDIGDDSTFPYWMGSEHFWSLRLTV